MIVRISAWIIVYDDKAISFKCSDGNVDNILNIFSKLVERNTGLDFDCPRKLVWNLLAPSAVIGDNANLGTIFVHLTEIRCLGGTHGNQHERAGSGSGKCRRDEKLLRGLHRFPQKKLIVFMVSSPWVASCMVRRLARLSMSRMSRRYGPPTRPMRQAMYVLLLVSRQRP